MRVTASDYSIVFLDGWGRSLEAQKRASMPHVTEITRDLANRHIHKGKRVDRKDLAELPRELLDRYADQGFLFEEVMQTRCHARVLMPKHPVVISPWEATAIAWQRRTFLRRQAECNIVAPGELVLDGIAGNPDGVNLDEEAGEEYKNTYKSERNMAMFPTGFEEWDWQFRGYLKMERELGLIPKAQISRMIVIVRWVCGDYKGGPKPLDKIYVIEYSADEIERNWRMILAHRDQMRKEGLIP